MMKSTVLVTTPKSTKNNQRKYAFTMNIKSPLNWENKIFKCEAIINFCSTLLIQSFSIQAPWMCNQEGYAVCMI